MGFLAVREWPAAESIIEPRSAVLVKNEQTLFAPEPHVGEVNFFLASVARSVWTPRITAVREEDDLLGTLCAKERKFLGIPTGLVFADGVLNDIVLADSANRSAVFGSAITALLQRGRTLGLRLMLPPDSSEFEMLPSLLRAFDVDYAVVPVTHHTCLPLASSYDTFLDRLGPRTRRNFRYYRRKVEAEGVEFVENIPLPEFEKASLRLLAEGVVGANKEAIARALAMFAHTRSPILAGLRDKHGEWLSVLGGWVSNGHPVIFFQMNSDRNHSKASLCLVTRGYVFESLIRKGLRDVIFWAGVGEPLNRYCLPVPSVSVYVDKRHKVWSGLRHSIANYVRKLPRAMAWRADWIVPNGALQHVPEQA